VTQGKIVEITFAFHSDGTASIDPRLPDGVRWGVAHLRQIDLRRFPLPLKLHNIHVRAEPGIATAPESYVVTFTVSMRVRDRNGSTETTFDVSRVFERPFVESPYVGPMMLDWARESLRWMVLHELDECLLVAGERRWDPHANDYRVEPSAGTPADSYDRIQIAGRFVP
jgi:hypothetical protein